MRAYNIGSSLHPSPGFIPGLTTRVPTIKKKHLLSKLAVMAKTHQAGFFLCSQSQWVKKWTDLCPAIEIDCVDNEEIKPET